MPEAAQQPPPQRSGAGIAAVIGAAVLLASTSLTAPREGERLKPYYDPAHIQTVCMGDTQVEMRPYTHRECLALLERRQSEDYAPPLLRCVPGFADPRHRYAFAASIDAAYNAGVAAFCRSRMARAFNAGDWPRGCDGFLGWYATARINGRPTPLKGLQRRREAERALCLAGEASPPPPIVKADYPVCVMVKPAPVLRAPQGKYDFELAQPFNDKGVS